MTPEETRARLLRFLRRMPCDLGLTYQGFAHRTDLPRKVVKVLLEQLRGEGLVLVTYPSERPCFYKPMRVVCVPGKMCKRPACRFHREARRLESLAEKAAAS